MSDFEQDYPDPYDDLQYEDWDDDLLTNTWIENIALVWILEKKYPGAVYVRPDAYGRGGRPLSDHYIAIHSNRSGDLSAYWRSWDYWKQEIQRQTSNTSINKNDNSPENRLACAMFNKGFPGGSWERCLYEAPATIEMFRERARQYLKEFKNGTPAR